MREYRRDILEKVSGLEQERDNTPIWRILKICNINYEIEQLGKLFKEDLKSK